VRAHLRQQGELVVTAMSPRLQAGRAVITLA
jgi:hypothetical protein